MPNYTAPLQDMAFVIDELAGVEAALGALPCYTEHGLGEDLTGAILDEAGKFASEVLAPLRPLGDTHPASCENGVVSLTPGYVEAWRQLAEAGWQGIAVPEEEGGQGLPEIYGTAAFEMWTGANMAFGLGPLLSTGAALTISAHGTAEQKATYLENMNSGRWSGTMNLTESGAGSDLGPMKSKAVPEGDMYRISGQKIYITWGDHEAVENIIHLVLARLPDAPGGSGGISLFIVPKFLPDEEGNYTIRNDVHPVSTEHKIGIHASPTCVMSFGDEGGALGTMLGQPNQGLACMFTMMNEARFKVGIQGLGNAEAAYQKALAYARERVQGGVPIIKHPDVFRMLYSMRSLNEAMRALSYVEGITLDLAHHLSDPQQRQAAQFRIDLVIPIIKGWLTEVGFEVTSLGVQVHGGMGYIEETGAAQYMRDVRIASIYEGTNGIQAADLVARKIRRDGGSAMEVLLRQVEQTLAAASESGNVDLEKSAQFLSRALASLRASMEVTVERCTERLPHALMGSFDLMMQAGYVLGGWQMLRAALISNTRLLEGSDNSFYAEKIATTHFYARHILPRATAHGEAVLNAAVDLLDDPGLVL